MCTDRSSEHICCLWFTWVECAVVNQTQVEWWRQTLQPFVTPLWSQITFAHLKTRWSRTRSFKKLRYRYCSVCLCAEPEKSLYVLLLHNLTTHWMVYSWGLFWPRELGVLNQRRSSRFCRGLGGETKQADEQRWIEIPPQWESDQGNRHQSPALLFSLTTWSPDALFECSISASRHVHMHAFTQKRRHCRR